MSKGTRNNNKKAILIGMGGHCGVVLDTARISGLAILGGTDLPINGHAASIKLGIPYLGSDEIIQEMDPQDIVLINCIGSSSSMRSRDNCFNIWKSKGYDFQTLIHPRATVAETAMVGEGSQIMAGAILQPFSRIGPNCIINTNVGIDHDCHIGHSCHVAPGAALSGNVVIGELCHIGTGAVIIQGVAIGKETLIAAGAVVLSGVKPNSIVKGVPGRVTIKAGEG